MKTVAAEVSSRKGCPSANELMTESDRFIPLR